MRVCPVCGACAWKTVYRTGAWDIQECAGCGFARIDPLPCRESRAAFYSQKELAARRVVKKRSLVLRFSAAMKRASTRLMNRSKVKSKLFYEKLRLSLKPGAAVLDVGCGDGSFLRLAKERFQCTGIEISEYLSDLAKRQVDIDVVTGDFLEADFRGRTFDAITLISLLEHLQDPALAVKKCFELLNTGGILFLKTVNYGCLNRRIIKGKDWTGFRPPDHVIYFNPSNLRRLLGNAGFRHIRMNSWPFNDNMYCEARKGISAGS